MALRAGMAARRVAKRVRGLRLRGVLSHKHPLRAGGTLTCARVGGAAGLSLPEVTCAISFACPWPCVCRLQACRATSARTPTWWRCGRSPPGLCVCVPFGMGVVNCYPRGAAGGAPPAREDAAGAGRGTGSSHPFRLLCFTVPVCTRMYLSVFFSFRNRGASAGEEGRLFSLGMDGFSLGERGG